MAVPDIPDLTRLLKFTGQYFTFNGRWANVFKALQTLRMIYILTGSVLSLWALFFGGLRSSLGIEMTYTCMGLIATTQHLYLCKRRKETEAIIRTLNEIRKTFQKESEEKFMNDTRVIWKVIKVYAVVIIGLCSSTSLLPFLADLVVWAVWRTPRAFRMPISMGSFIDKEPIRDAKYFATMITSSVWTVFSSTAKAGVDSFLIVSCFSYSSMVQTFSKKLRLHPEFTPMQTTAHLRRLAAHQQALFKLSVKMRALFGLPFFAQNLLGAVSVCSLLYVISADGSSISPLLLIAYSVNLVILVSVIGSTAYVGQHVENKTSEIFEALYEMDWYSLRPSDRRYMVTMLCAAREPFKIHFCGLLPLDLENFMNILTTSYSYFMFLKSVM